MGNEWPLVKLGDFVQILTGHPFKSKDYSEHEGIRLLRGDNIAQGTLRWQNVKLLPQEKIGEKEHNYFLRTGDVILAMDRPWIEAGLKTAQINENDLPCLLVQRVACLRCEDPSDQDFIRYIISSYGFVQYVKLIQTGTAVPHISGKQIKDYEFRLPPKSVRKQIGRIVKQLDDKANLNRQINQTLEQMAQTLFKSWFVDFDPVIDNALDAGNPIPDELQHRAEARKAVRESEGFKPLPEDVRQLFPDAFEESELGWVPKGWKVTMLGDMCVELRRGISPKYIEEGGIKVINQKCIRNHEVNYDLARRNNPELRKVDGREVQLGDVLVNSTGVGTLGRMAQVTYILEPTVVDSHVTLVRVNSDICPMYTFGQLLLSIENRVERLGEGSTGQTELSRKILSEQQVVLPPLTIANHIEATFKSFADKKVASRNEVDSLTKLRDTLLPKLISGELRLDDVEAAVEQETVSA